MPDNHVYIELSWSEACRMLRQIADDLTGTNPHASDDFLGFIIKNKKEYPVKVSIFIKENFREVETRLLNEYGEKISQFINTHTWIPKKKSKKE